MGHVTFSRVGAVIWQGDCLDVMPQFEESSVDALITDPPYGLEFMGKDWDRGVPGEKFWRAALRVAKPGAHLAAFGSPRTFHRLACAIEDAGWELRDTLMWVYGSGFPKSMDVAKAIDRERTEDIEPTRVICRAVRAAMDSLGLKSRDLTEAFGNCNPRLIDHWAARDSDSQPNLPTWEQWLRLRDLLPLAEELDIEVWRLNERKGTPGANWDAREVLGTMKGGQHADGRKGCFGVGAKIVRVDIPVTAPASDAAKAWEGWGTSLKPAWEPIILARAPMGQTVAQNVQAFGTGALHVEACRVDSEGDPRAGRFPANMLHDGSAEVLELFPQVKSGTLTAEHQERGGFAGAKNCFGDARGGGRGFYPASSGSAARFFYSAKADESDRGASNTHPTVKPTDLMRWLVRLLAPAGAVVLDPFAGSGSTLVAAKLEHCRAIGIELDPEHCATAARRLAQGVLPFEV